MENSRSQLTHTVIDTHLGSVFSTGVKCFRQPGFPLSNTPLIPKSLNTSEKFGLQNTTVLCQGRILLFLLGFISTFLFVYLDIIPAMTTMSFLFYSFFPF